MNKMTPYEKELKRKVRKLEKREKFYLVCMNQTLTSHEQIIEELKELANELNTDEMISAGEISGRLKVLLRAVNAL